MSEFIFKLPDLGEGTVEAEIVEWHVQPGDEVSEGDIIADVMTDKANVEVPAPVSGTVLRTSGEPGDLIAVGAELAAFTTSNDDAAARISGGATDAADDAPVSVPAVLDADNHTEPVASAAAAPAPAETHARQPSTDDSGDIDATATRSSASEEQPLAGKVITSPAIRRRAKEAGLDLRTVTGTGPRGRILRKDLDAALSSHPAAPAVASGVGPIEEIKVIGVRRVIANRLQASKREIPHFAYVEEVDITALESLRQRVNAHADQPSLTYLPFIAKGLIRALGEFPNANAQFNSEAGVLQRYHRVHLGIATQTPDGLKVPVVHNANSRSLWNLAEEINRVAEAARNGTATPGELRGSTITLTSLGKLGGIASTPVINSPEVAIIGVNKAVQRPMVVDGDITVRLMMNLSSSFDHRFIDGYDAASLIALLKDYLEEPALLFMDPPPAR